MFLRKTERTALKFIQDTECITLDFDTPSSQPDEDRFGYASFAKKIAKVIYDINPQEGLVLAINGSWGSGKTTAINYIKHYLNELLLKSKNPSLDSKILTIHEFNPWWFTGRDNLVDEFLAYLQKELAITDFGFYRYALMKVPFSVLVFLSFVEGIVDFIPSEWRNSLKKYLRGLLIIILPATLSLMIIKGWLSMVSAAVIFFLIFFYVNSPLFTSRGSADLLRRKVTKKLQDSRKRFLFIIDDIDRLMPNEVVDLFGAIKSLTNFPNVVYLLIFDRELAVNSIQRSFADKKSRENCIADGNAYLEKIIQVSFSLPLIAPPDLRSFFHYKLSKILPKEDINLFDDSFSYSFDQLIRNPRQINKISNTLSVVYHAIRDEVNHVDIIAMECIRVLLPELYELIRENCEYFTDISLDLLEKDRLQEFYKSFLNKTQSTERQFVINILGKLFPISTSFINSTNLTLADDQSVTWQREKRICNSTIFLVYFHLDATTNNSAHQDARELVECSANVDQISHLLRIYHSAQKVKGFDRLSECLKRLPAFHEKITPEFAGAMLRSIFLIGDKIFNFGKFSSASSGHPSEYCITFDKLVIASLEELIIYLLGKNNSGGYNKILENLMGESEALDLLISVVLNEDKKLINYVEADTNVSVHQEGLADGVLKKYREIVIGKIEVAAQQESFLDIENLLFKLLAWSVLSDGNCKNLKQWIASVLRDKKKLPKLALAFKSFGIKPDIFTTENSFFKKIMPLRELTIIRDEIYSESNLQKFFSNEELEAIRQILN